MKIALKYCKEITTIISNWSTTNWELKQLTTAVIQNLNLLKCSTTWKTKISNNLKLMALINIWSRLLLETESSSLIRKHRSFLTSRRQEVICLWFSRYGRQSDCFWAWSTGTDKPGWSRKSSTRTNWPETLTQAIVQATDLIHQTKLERISIPVLSRKPTTTVATRNRTATTCFTSFRSDTCASGATWERKTRWPEEDWVKRFLTCPCTNMRSL